MDRYRQTQSISALHYITIAVAATISAGKPEYRAPYMMPGVILLSFGVILYGWAAEYTLPGRSSMPGPRYSRWEA
ncbi:hypothetical protein ACCO45_001166 [Purpureocillium lilacinum]|uniref:Uncharacterized protein n=1 Tax=Purpureocillium lilacinum TaxID=33203 RepID=A0ACC4E6B5_PURLI